MWLCYNTLVMAKDYKWMLLALLSVTYFLAQGSRQIFNAVLPQIKDERTFLHEFRHCIALGVCARRSGGDLGRQGLFLR